MHMVYVYEYHTASKKNEHSASVLKCPPPHSRLRDYVSALILFVMRPRRRHDFSHLAGAQCRTAALLACVVFCSPSRFHAVTVASGSSALPGPELPPQGESVRTPELGGRRTMSSQRRETARDPTRLLLLRAPRDVPSWAVPFGAEFWHRNRSQVETGTARSVAPQGCPTVQVVDAVNRVANGFDWSRPGFAVQAAGRGFRAGVDALGFSVASPTPSSKAPLSGSGPVLSRWCRCAPAVCHLLQPGVLLEIPRKR